MACIASPISAIPQWLPTQGPHAHSAHWQVTCWNETSMEKKTLLSLPSNNVPFFQANDWSHKPHLLMVWLLTLASDWKAKTRRVRYSCMWNSVVWLRESSLWPKIGLRNNLTPSKFKRFSRGACAHTLIYTPPGHFKYDGYGAEVYISAVFLSYCH